MSNTTDDDRSELLDDDKLEGGEFPPERALAVDEYGTTAAQQRIQEPLEQRVLREEPEPTTGPADDLADDAETQALGDLIAPGPDAAELEGEIGDAPGTEGELDVDDLVAGDSTTRDVATELEAPRPAEEEAMHVTELPE